MPGGPTQQTKPDTPQQLPHQPQDSQHGAGISSDSAAAAATLHAAAPAFIPSASGAVTAPHARPSQGGRGGGGGRGRGRGSSLSQELRSQGGRQSGRGSGNRGSDRRPSEGSTPAGQNVGEGVLGSSPGRRGITANHLLAFQTRRDSERQAAAGSSGRGGRSGGPPRRPAIKPQPYNRDKFLHASSPRGCRPTANFRFLVSNAVDARRFEADPDLMLEWEDVVQVEMLSAAPIRCPITLEEHPFCPQITPCGHVFSFPAIIGHLVAHGGPELRKSAPCPLCYTQIAARELRLVQMHQVTAPQVGQVAEFRLLRRPRDSITPEAVASAGLRSGRAVAVTGGSPAATNATAGSPGKGKGAGNLSGGVAATGEAAGTGSACNRFSKFTLVGEAAATALWVAEAQRLAAYAAQVTAEGGLEAAFEAPNVFSAIDALAARARSAAERRQRTLLEGADPMAQDSLVTPEEAGQQAAQAVKGATTAALSAAAVHREQQAAAAARDRLFPSLAAAAPLSPPQPVQSSIPPPVRPRPASAQAKAAAAFQHQAAFSDEDTSAESSPSGGNLRRQSKTAAVPITVGSSSHSGTAAGPSTLPGPSAAAPGTVTAGSTADLPGSTADLPGSFKSTTGLLGSSPAEAGAAGGPAAADSFFFYQASDGQWLFLCPLNLRMLLSHYGAYSACPPTLSAKVLEVEDVAQDEASRRRMRVLAHLPLTAIFKLCEVDLSGLLPPEALAPFADELAQRERKRSQRAKQEARRAKQERAAAAAEAAAAANTGLSAAELRAMPLPSASLLPAVLNQEATEDAFTADEAEQAAVEAPAQPQAGISYAALARDGFAATGPTLSTQPGSQREMGAASGGSAGARGAWGPKAATPAAAPAWGAISTAAGAAPQPDSAASAVQQLGALHVSSGSGKGGKKKLVLFGGSQRKY